MSSLLLGCAKVDITPLRPIALAGFAHRQGHFEKVDSPIHARILFFRHDSERQVLIVSADLIWWGNDRLTGIRNRLRERWGFSDAQMLFHGTHNHSGPQTSDCFTPSLGQPHPEYIAYLEQCIVAGVEQASQTFEPVTIERGRGVCEMGIHRRNKVDGRIVMAPNPDIPVDSELAVLRFAVPDGRTKALLVHYACHPTASGDNSLSSEFPGMAMEMLEAHGDGALVAAFLQGCCGDVRPALIRDGHFYRGGTDDAQRLGRLLADEVMSVLARPMKRLAAGTLEVRASHVPLPTQRIPTTDELIRFAGTVSIQAVHEEDAGSIVPASDSAQVAGGVRMKLLDPDQEAIRQWSRFLLSDPGHLHRPMMMELTAIELAAECSLLSANAEMAGEYGHFVKTCYDGRVLPVCYSNGMIGYVSTRDQIVEGGYEAKEFIYYFGLPAPFAPESEETIREAIRKLLADGYEHGGVQGGSFNG